MHISNIYIENFRIFGKGDRALILPLNAGLTAIIGENDEGKSAIIDALRFTLGTNDPYYLRIEDDDFHRNVEDEKNSSSSAQEIWIQCRFSGLSSTDLRSFAEHLTYEDDGDISLYINWIARKHRSSKSRKWAEVRSGKAKTGPILHANSRELIKATYLRPLRDAHGEMSAGRNSRLSQVLGVLEGISTTINSEKETLLDVSDVAFDEIEKHPSLSSVSAKLNAILKELSFQSDILEGRISVSQHSDDISRLKQVLEKLDLGLGASDSDIADNRGLGSNNLLFMGCEMLLLEASTEIFPIMLIEEPEAHIHPQRQLLIIKYLQEQAENKNIQILLTTHSPQVASVIKLKNIALLKDRTAYPLGADYTELNTSDYRFLERFLDATKANLFFAKGVLIVEGDAENILLPTIASIIGMDFTKHGVSIVNVGHTGLGRFARIFLRKKSNTFDPPSINVRTACLLDLDILPACAPRILALDPSNANRKWTYEEDYESDEIQNKRSDLSKKISGQNVRSFPSELWTLEFDLANNGLLGEVWIAAKLAKEDGNSKSRLDSIKEGISEVRTINRSGLSTTEKAVHCYSRFTSSCTEYAKGKSKVSKSIAAQYLSECLIRRYRNRPNELRDKLPNYIVDAIEFVTKADS